MLPFEFLNNSFSVAISIFTLVFGMAYPLLHEFVQRIEDKYVSSHIVTRFKSERTYVLFNWQIIICMIETVTCPLLIQLWNNNWWTCGIIAFQLISVFCLMLNVVLLIQLILVYYDARQLFGQVSSQKDVSELPNLLCICRYASKYELNELYGDCMSSIFEFIFEEQRKTKKGDAVIYSKEVNDIIRKILDLSYKDKGSFFYERNDITWVLLNKQEGRSISIQTCQLLWITINRIVLEDNFGWFKQYWTIAYQYHMYNLSNQINNDSQDERKMFEEMHIMIGGLLCFHKKYEWLSYILFFTNTQPASYPLVPSSAAQIIKVLYDIERKYDGIFTMQELSRYCFIGLKNDVSDIGMVVKYVEDYLALIVIRLWSVNNYNYTFSEPFDFPSPSDDLDDNDKRIKYIQRLINCVRCWYSNGEIAKLHLPQTPKKLEVLDLLQGYMNNLKSKNSELTERCEIDKEKLKIVKQEVVKSLSSMNLNIPQGIPDKTKDSITIPIHAGGSMESDAFMKGRHISITGIGDVIAEILKAKTQIAYGRGLISNRYLRHTYQVRYQDIFMAIDKLQIDHSYVILSLGVFLDTFDGLYGFPQELKRKEDNRLFYGEVEIEFIDSRQSAMIVIKSEDLPYYEFTTWDSPSTGMVKIDEELCLYSNVDHWSGSTFYLDFVRILKMELCNDSSFAYLQIDQNEISDELDLNTIKPLGNAQDPS